MHDRFRTEERHKSQKFCPELGVFGNKREDRKVMGNFCSKGDGNTKGTQTYIIVWFTDRRYYFIISDTVGSGAKRRRCFVLNSIFNVGILISFGPDSVENWKHVYFIARWGRRLGPGHHQYTVRIRIYSYVL